MPLIHLPVGFVLAVCSVGFTVVLKGTQINGLASATVAAALPVSLDGLANDECKQGRNQVLI